MENDNLNAINSHNFVNYQPIVVHKTTHTRCSIKGKKGNMFKVKKLTNVGNIDKQQDPTKPLYGTKILKNIQHKKLSKLRDLVRHYIKVCDLGGGNFIPPKVFKDTKYIGYFSYNGRFWRKPYYNNQAKKERRV